MYPTPAGASGPELSYNGAPVTTGEFGSWTPIGAEHTASGYDVAWKIPGADQYTVWTTDSNGNYNGNLTGGVVSGSSSILINLETTFQQDLNGDGTIGPPPPPPPTVIESKGATDLDQVGSNYFLYAHGTTSGPELSLGNGAPVVAGQFGPWAPIGAEVTASGYDVAWKMSGADQYEVWSTTSSGNFSSQLVGLVSGTSLALENLETT